MCSRFLRHPNIINMIEINDIPNRYKINHHPELVICQTEEPQFQKVVSVEIP